MASKYAFSFVFNLVEINYQPVNTTTVINEYPLAHLDWKEKISDDNQDSKLWIKYVYKLISLILGNHKQGYLAGRLTQIY